MIGPHQAIICSLTWAGQGAAAWIAIFERRQVVAAAHRLGQLQHPAEHRRHQLAVRDPVLLDQRQVVLGVEVLHHDHGAAVADRQRTPRPAAPSGTAAPATGRSCPRGSATACCRKSNSGSGWPAGSRAAAAGCPWAGRWCPTSTASACPASRRRSVSAGYGADRRSSKSTNGPSSPAPSDHQAQRHLRALSDRLAARRRARARDVISTCDSLLLTM